MKIVPLGANVVVKRLPAEEQTAGGIVLPDAAKEKPRQGRVLSVGDGRMLKNGSGSRIKSAKAIGCCSAVTRARK